MRPAILAIPTSSLALAGAAAGHRRNPPVIRYPEAEEG